MEISKNLRYPIGGPDESMYSVPAELTQQSKKKLRMMSRQNVER